LKNSKDLQSEKGEEQLAPELLQRLLSKKTGPNQAFGAMFFIIKWLKQKKKQNND